LISIPSFFQKTIFSETTSTTSPPTSNTSTNTPQKQPIQFSPTSQQKSNNKTPSKQQDEITLKIDDLPKEMIEKLEKGENNYGSVLCWMLLLESIWKNGNEVRNQLNPFIRSKLPNFLTNLFSSTNFQLSGSPSWNRLSFFSKCKF
jgi:hypothetical protein